MTAGQFALEERVSTSQASQSLCNVLVNFLANF